MIDSEDNKEYLPIEGLADFNKATAELLLGANNAAIREVTHNPTGAVQDTVLQHPQHGPSLFWFASLLRSRCLRTRYALWHVVHELPGGDRVAMHIAAMSCGFV